MKKRKLVILLLFLSGLSGGLFAQDGSSGTQVPVDEDSGMIMYREVVEEPGTPGYLYNKAIELFNYYYTNPTSMYSVQDRVNGKVEATGRMLLYYDDDQGYRQRAGMVNYTIRIEFKKDRYRYTITDFNLKSTSKYPLEKWLNKEDPTYNSRWDLYLMQIDTTMSRLTETLKEKMKPVVEKVDEW